MATRRKKRQQQPVVCRLWAWAPETRANINHIRAAVRHALWEKAVIATKSDEWYAAACDISRQWRDEARAKSVKQLARKHLEYWRHRAHMNGHYGTPGDPVMYRRWQRYVPQGAGA